MYKKILLTTDGSKLANATALAGVALAAQLQAEIVGLFVAENYQYPMEVDFLPVVSPSVAEYQSAMQKQGQMHLAPIEEAALAAGLRFTGLVEFADAIAHKIVQTAAAQHCDLIYIGSHGRGGWGQLLLGSVTNKVLSSCHIPVLVDRLVKEPT